MPNLSVNPNIPNLGMLNVKPIARGLQILNKGQVWS